MGNQLISTPTKYITCNTHLAHFLSGYEYAINKNKQIKTNVDLLIYISSKPTFWKHFKNENSKYLEDSWNKIQSQILTMIQNTKHSLHAVSMILKCHDFQIFTSKISRNIKSKRLMTKNTLQVELSCFFHHCHVNKPGQMSLLFAVLHFLMIPFS